jgi:glycoprotein 2-beta-D-xylosyltransferase
MCFLWGIGVCGYLSLMAHQYSQMARIVPSTTATTGSIRTRAKRIESDQKTSSDGQNQKQEDQKQESAEKNQGWMTRRFHLGDPISDPRHQQTKKGVSTESQSGFFQRPKWLDIDAQKQAHLKSDGDDDHAQQDSTVCKSFDRTVMHPTHGCQVNSDTRQVYCNFVNLRIDNSLIDMDKGGEKLETVMGRKEADELPVYTKGAFSVRPKPTIEVPLEQRVGMHYLEDVLNNLVYPTKKNKGKFDSSCVETRNGTTLMITRYEYVNLYHTLTDWWNAFSVLLPEQVDRKEKVNILFLDAHPQGNLDPVWEQVFGVVEYVKHLPGHGVCFERAVLIPPGYTSAIYPDIGRHFDSPRIRCPTPRIADAFSTFFLKAYRLETVTPIPGKVVIIDRQPYISHPRSNLDGFQRKMNFEDLEKRLRTGSKATSVEIVRFETLTHSEQVRKVRQAHILIGNHGAGLTNLMFMDRNAHVLEFTTDFQDFFIYLAEWKGIDHHPISITSGSRLSEVELTRTISIVNELMP